jgi:hypothetical protein
MAIDIRRIFVVAVSLPVISGAKNVTKVAKTMAPPAHKIPRRAVTGELICFNPIIKIAATIK